MPAASEIGWRIVSPELKAASKSTVIALGQVNRNFTPNGPSPWTVASDSSTSRLGAAWISLSDGSSVGTRSFFNPHVVDPNARGWAFRIDAER